MVHARLAEYDRSAVKNLKLLQKSPPDLTLTAHIPFDVVLLDVVHFTLKMSELDHSMRNGLYRTLEVTLFGNSFVETNYIAQAVKIFSLDIIQEVMPFVQFCIKSDELMNRLTEVQMKDRKMRLVTLKNSLIIGNHFQTSLSRK